MLFLFYNTKAYFKALKNYFLCKYIVITKKALKALKIKQNKILNPEIMKITNIKITRNKKFTHILCLASYSTQIKLEFSFGNWNISFLIKGYLEY